MKMRNVLKIGLILAIVLFMSARKGEAKEWIDADFDTGQATDKNRHVSTKKAKAEIKSRTYAGVTMDTINKNCELRVALSGDRDRVCEMGFNFSIFNGYAYSEKDNGRIYKIKLSPKCCEKIDKKLITSLIKKMKKKYKYINTKTITNKVKRQTRIEQALSSGFFRGYTLSEITESYKTDRITRKYTLKFNNKGDLIILKYEVASADGKKKYDYLEIEYISREEVKRQKILAKKTKEEGKKKRQALKDSLNEL